MSMFDIYYSGVITIEAETEEDARNAFNNNLFDYGDIEKIKDVTSDYESLLEKLDNDKIEY